MRETNFTRSVLMWYDAGHRNLPWRQTKDAYRILVSEIMLQQTRAETVISYYHRFLDRYPTVSALADADEEELLKLWEGLGYYSRARNLRRAAQAVMQRHGGVLPDTVQALRALPGVGAYTAGAVAAIAYGVPVCAVDGNVERVICRYNAITKETGTSAVRREIEARAQRLVPADRPGAFANAMMELGATVCTPKSPSCLLCPVREGCGALAQGIAAALPVKPKRKAQRIEKRAVLLVFAENRVLVIKRQEKLLHGLYVFPDVPDVDDAAGLCASLARMGIQAAYDERLGQARHVFTHIIWEMQIHALAARTCVAVEGGMWVTAQELAALPLPTAVRTAREMATKRLTSSSA